MRKATKMKNDEIRVGDRVHVASGGSGLPMLGTVTAIERSAAATVYVVDVGNNNAIRAVEVAVAEVANEPSWRQTAALVTKELDAARAALDAARVIARQFGEERDALRRRAAQIAELLRTEGDADETL